MSITFKNLFFDFIDFHHAIFHRCLILPLIHRNLWITATVLNVDFGKSCQNPILAKFSFFLYFCVVRIVFEIYGWQGSWLLNIFWITIARIFMVLNCQDGIVTLLHLVGLIVHSKYIVDCLKLPSFYDLICKLYWKLVKIQNDFLDMIGFK